MDIRRERLTTLEGEHQVPERGLGEDRDHGVNSNPQGRATTMEGVRTKAKEALYLLRSTAVKMMEM